MILSKAVICATSKLGKTILRKSETFKKSSDLSHWAPTLIIISVKCVSKFLPTGGMDIICYFQHHFIFAPPTSYCILCVWKKNISYNNNKRSIVVVVMKVSTSLRRECDPDVIRTANKIVRAVYANLGNW